MRSIKDCLNWILAELRYRLTRKTFKIDLTPEFKNQLAKLPKEQQKEILEAINQIRKNPYKGKRIEER